MIDGPATDERGKESNPDVANGTKDKSNIDMEEAMAPNNTGTTIFTVNPKQPLAGKQFHTYLFHSPRDEQNIHYLHNNNGNLVSNGLSLMSSVFLGIIA